MHLDADALADEFAFVRKGSGTLHSAFDRRVGKQLRILCAIEATDRLGVVRNKFAETIDRLLRGEPDTVQLSVRATLALHPEADHSRLTDREAWLGEHLGCGPRNVRRHVDVAYARLVERAGRAVDDRKRTGPAVVEQTHYMRALRAHLRLDTPCPELREHRQLVFTAARTTEIISMFSLPRIDGDVGERRDLHIEVTQGGRLNSVERLSEADYRFVVELAEAQQDGDVHDLGMLFRLPDGQPMRPHYLVHPLVACESLDLTITFASTELPVAIWRLDGAPLRMVDDSKPDLEKVSVDRFGELRLTFDGLRPGLSYGAKWSI